MPRLIKKHGKKALILGLILVLIGYYFLIPNSQAAAIASRKLTVTDSRPSQTSVRYTFTGDHSATSVKCLNAQFCNAATGACVFPTGMSVTAASATSTGWTGWTYATWSGGFATTSTGFKYTAAGGEAGGSARAFSATGITNPSSGATYYTRVNTYTDTGCTAAADDGIAAYAIVSGVSISATVAETLTFTIGDTAIGFGPIGITNLRFTTADEVGVDTTEPSAGAPSVVTLATNANGGATITIQDVGSGSAAGLYKSAATAKLIVATTPVATVGGTESYAPYAKNAGGNLAIAAGFQSDGGTVVTLSPQTFVTASGPLNTLNTFDILAKAGASATTAGGTYSDTLILIATPTY